MPRRYSSVRNSHITEEVLKTVSTKEAEVKGAIATADKQLVMLEKRFEELELSDDDGAAASTQGKSSTLQQLEEERKALDASRKLLEELLAKSQGDVVAKAAQGNNPAPTTITFGNDSSGFQAGVIHGGVSAITFGKK